MISVTEKALKELRPLLEGNQGKLLRVQFKGFG